MSCRVTDFKRPGKTGIKNSQREMDLAISDKKNRKPQARWDKKNEQESTGVEYDGKENKDDGGCGGGGGLKGKK